MLWSQTNCFLLHPGGLGKPSGRLSRDGMEIFASAQRASHSSAALLSEIFARGRAFKCEKGVMHTGCTILI
jgi:hypothetical protein